jgi:hypothetical protein
MKRALLMVSIAGCGQVEALSDAPMAQSDAPTAQSDAPMSDAPCVPVVTQLLVNPAFDEAPRGKGWAEQPIYPDTPIIDFDEYSNAHSAPYMAWLGGWDGGGADYLYQQVTIPANTTQLRLYGYWIVASTEPGSSVVDTGLVSLTTTTDATIQDVRRFSNLDAVSSWQLFDYTFPQDLSGQTVRLRFESHGNGFYWTSFSFDTLALTATHCP